MSRHDLLRKRMQAEPRLVLGEYPTPLQALPSLGRELGRPLFVKRDDQLGPLGGGNKTRKLEYLMTRARQRAARKVSTFGGLQSNHARLTAGVARMLGMEAHLFCLGPRPERLEGNLLLAELVGAHLHFLGRAGGGRRSIETAIRMARATAFLRLGRHYFIPVGGHTWRGALGYVQAALEIDEQARAQGLEKATLVVAAGSGGTLAGLMAGLALVDSPLRMLGIDVGALWTGFRASIARLAQEVCARLGEPRKFGPGSVPLVEETYVGRRYGTPSEAGLAAIRTLARREGVLLDPVYTAKAFAGLLDLAAHGELRGEDPIVFWHTGGLPALFATLPPP